MGRGDRGTILHSRDGGLSWQAQTSGTTESLYSIYGSADGRLLWATGYDGTILQSIDGGQSWLPRARGSTQSFVSIYGTGNGRTLWVAGDGGMFLHTVDGGQSWQRQPSGTSSYLFSIYGTGDGRMLWAAGDHGTIIHTDDGGQSWQLQSSGTSETLLSIYGADNGKTLWAAGSNGTILHSSDSGQSWQPQTSGTSELLSAVYVGGNGKSLVAVGFHGMILHSSDGGLGWSQIRNTSPYRYRPALWVWLLLGLATSLGTMGFFRLQRPVPAPNQSIENAALSDQPATNLKQDLLDVADIVQALAEFLRNRNTEPPVTLSVEGRWGLGKTSAMRMLESELKRAHVPTVWFNAWHNEDEAQMLAFLTESIRQEAFPPWWDVREIPFRFRLLVVRFERWPVIPLLLAAAVLFILHPALDWLRHIDTEDVKNLGNLVDRLRDLNWAQLIATATAVGAAYPLLRKLLRLATGISAQPSDLLPETESKSGNAARTSFRTRFAGQLREAIEAFGPDRRITIFIDDLDRCQPEQVRQTLEAVNFLISSAGCFVVMGIARDIVEASIGLGFKEIADELVESNNARAAKSDDAAEDAEVDKESAAKARRRAFARNYLLKLINLTILLRPYTGETLANVATSTASRAERPSRIRQAVPYALFAATVLATVLLWSVPMIPHMDPEKRVLQDESYTLPGALDRKQLKSLVVERDANERLVGEKRTYEIGEKPAEQAAPVPPPKTPPAGTVPPSAKPQTSTERSDFEPGQTYNPSRWLWWMAPLVCIGAGFVARGLLFRRQRPIQDSPEFRDALRLWRVAYENELRTPREIKRFVNELRYKAIRFRGPQPRVPVLGKTNESLTRSLPRESALILIAILDRLNKDGKDLQNFGQWLASEYHQTFSEHLERFGEPREEDWDRYRSLFA